MNAPERTDYTTTTNACKLCAPLGASLVFKGIRGAIPLIHGSQGCSTYIRRYLISHYKEPVDIASSNFSEETAVFGGGANLKLSISNVNKQYEPEVVGISTTCLSETIGDDVDMILKGFNDEADKDIPPVVHVSTPSYSGTHIDGFHGAVKALVKKLAEKKGKRSKTINLFPGMVSPYDLRYLKEVIEDFGLESIMVPDYSDTLDGSVWSEYQKIPEGGTGVDDIREMGDSLASIEFGAVLTKTDTAGEYLRDQFKVPCFSGGLPIGIKETDRFLKNLEEISGRSIPEKYINARGRLVDSFVDGHKYVFEAKAVVYGEEDFVVGMASFLSEIGVVPVLCASGGKSGLLEEKISEIIPEYFDSGITVIDGADYDEIGFFGGKVKPDFLIGSSKGYSISRKLGIPLIRAGFPVHDRVGGSRITHVGYRGAQELFDRIANTILESRQEESEVGYSYM